MSQASQLDEEEIKLLNEVIELRRKMDETIARLRLMESMRIENPKN